MACPTATTSRWRWIQPDRPRSPGANLAATTAPATSGHRTTDRHTAFHVKRTRVDHAISGPAATVGCRAAVINVDVNGNVYCSPCSRFDATESIWLARAAQGRQSNVSAASSTQSPSAYGASFVGRSLQLATAGFVAERREAVQARFEPPALLAHACPYYFGKLHQPPAVPGGRMGQGSLPTSVRLLARGLGQRNPALIRYASWRSHDGDDTHPLRAR